MTDSHFFTIHQHQNTMVVEVSSEVSSFANDEVLAEIERVIQKYDPQAAVIDFAHVSFFGSSLLEALRTLWNHVHATGGKMALCNITGVAKEVITVSHMENIWPLFETRDAALQYVAE